MARPEKGFQFFRRRGIMGLPRKGTETFPIRPLLCNLHEFQLIPARGRKRKRIDHCIIDLTISTYPRKGTETAEPPTGSAALYISTYPRKGTETECGHCSHHSYGYFNLSPQGDGNSKHPDVSVAIRDFNLSPQGDGNSVLTSVAVASTSFNLSPKNPLRRCAPALPKGELFRLPLPCTKLPLRGSWYGVSRD